VGVGVSVGNRVSVGARVLVEVAVVVGRDVGVSVGGGDVQVREGVFVLVLGGSVAVGAAVGARVAVRVGRGVIALSTATRLSLGHLRASNCTRMTSPATPMIM